MISTCHETEERDQEAAAYAHRLGLMVEPADSTGGGGPPGRHLPGRPGSLDLASFGGRTLAGALYESNLRHQNATSRV